MYSNPYPTVVVGNETADVIDRQSVVILWIVAKMCDVLSLHPVQAATVGGSPHHSMRVHGTLPLRAGAEGARIRGTRDVVGETRPIETIEARFRSDPQRVCGPHRESAHDVIAEAFGILGNVAIGGESWRPDCQAVDSTRSHAEPKCA